MNPYTYAVATSRNHGIVSPQGQELLKHALIAVAGCGGAGGSTAVELARLGVGKFRLADPDHMDISNLNRQEGAFMSTAGVNKAETIAKIIKDINPEAEVEVYSMGITEENVEAFLTGASLGLEEIDYRAPWYTRLVHITAQRLQIPLMTGIPIAWNAFTFLFDYTDPNCMSFDEYTGLKPEKLKADDFRSYDIKLTAYIPELPLYIKGSVVKEVLAEKIDIPCVSPAIALAAAQTSAFAYFFLTKERPVKSIPHYYATGDLYQKPASIVGSYLQNIVKHLKKTVRVTRHADNRHMEAIQKELNEQGK